MQTEHLPWELEEEILLSLSNLKSFARFRSVCKRWNTLFSDKCFIKKHLARARPKFIMVSRSKIYSVDVNLDDRSVEVQNLALDFPCYELALPKQIQYCDGLLMCATSNGFGICNPWLRQIKWTKSGQKHWFNGMVHDNRKADNHYRILETYFVNRNRKAKIHEFGSDGGKSFEIELVNSVILPQDSVSLNETLYWIDLNTKSNKFFIQSFDFSTKTFRPHCTSPNNNNFTEDINRSLAIFRRNRFSYLEQNEGTRDINIWVTKEKIKNGDGGDVEWMNFMNVSVPKWSNLKLSNHPPSYFINEDKGISTLVLCCLNNEEKPHIYIAKGDEFYQIKISDFFEDVPSHCTYFPSLVQVPTFTMTDREKIKHVEYNIFAVPRGVEAINGNGGNMWDDGFFDNVKKINIGWDYYGIVFLKFEYCNGNAVVVGDAHGNTTLISNREIIIDDDDYIEAIEGSYTEYRICSIKFKLHKRNRLPSYGYFNGYIFRLGGGGLKINGFYGRNSDAYITALGVHLSVAAD